MSEQIKLDRSYVRNSSMAIAIAVTILAAVTLAVSGLAEAQPSKQNVPSSNGSFGPIKQIDAGLLNVGYAEAGPADGLRSFFCTAGLMTFTASSMSLLCWQRRATG